VSTPLIRLAAIEASRENLPRVSHELRHWRLRARAAGRDAARLGQRAGMSLDKGADES
jgi:hypothetical protein